MWSGIIFIIGLDLPSDSSVSMSSSGVIMFIKHRTLPDSASDFACVPAIKLMAFTLIYPLTCWMPILARLTFNLVSPSSMPFRASTAASVTPGSMYSQYAIPLL